MVERSNERPAFTRRTHGSERRGVFPVPNVNVISQLTQSREDKARLLRMAQERLRARQAEVEASSDLGNKSLPAYAHKQELLSNIDAYKAVIVGGATGSGKSTQLPQYLFEAGYDMTIALVPRRVIADGLGERIRVELEDQITGLNSRELVGIVHGERTERHEANKILVMTPNTFIKMEPELRERYAEKKLAVIADEIHEANLFTEIATGAAAISVRDNNNWRLIAASATHNADSLRHSFEKLNNGFVPSIEIEGRPFNVDLRETPNQTPMQVYTGYGKDHEKAMIFTSGKREIDHIIDETIRELETQEPGSSKKVVFRKLHGELTEVELAHIDDPVPEGFRLVVVSSPAGMSGITIPGVTMVITDGTINRSELDDDGAAGLKRFYLSKAGIIQQIGRAGRDVPGGVGYLAMPITVRDDQILRRGGQLEARQMYFKSFEERDEHEPPEIYNSNLSSVVLSVAALDRRFNAINEYIPHPVEASEIIKSEETLARLGALDDDDRVTDIGLSMERFPVIPELARGLHEASLSGRGLQHMARAAFIAAAIDAGGLQNYQDKDRTEWKSFIRPSTSDDFIAQLDIMTAVEETARAEKPLNLFAEEFALHAKRIERARKAARKILGVLHIRPENIIVTPPLPNEETQLRSDFTAGMIDLVYEEIGKVPRSRKTLYRNIHGQTNSTTRTLSDRSVATPRPGQYVAGIPRWYETQSKHAQEFIRHDIIDHALFVNPDVVGTYAQQNGLLKGEHAFSRIEGDQGFEYEQPMFGSIPFGEPVRSSPRERTPEPTRKSMLNRALEKPGEAQLAARKIAEELTRYQERTPAALLQVYRKSDAPEDITKETIKQLLYEFTASTRSVRAVDDQLSEYLYSANVSINKFYDDEARLKLMEMSPDIIRVGKVEFRVFYDQGQPYVTTRNKQQVLGINQPVYLPDGREVLWQRESSAKAGGTRRVSFGSLEV
jgi:HrpA-like RNA helicase